MKKIVLAGLTAALMLSACTSYKNVGLWMDSQTLPAMTSVAKPGAIAVTIESSPDLQGIPEKGTLAEKKGYLVPLPFVGFFGKNLLLKPGETTLQTPLEENLKTSLENELASKNLTLTENYTLKVTVDSSNFKFRYRNKGFVVWLFILQFGHKKEWCAPTDLSLSVTYELKKGETVVKKGSVTKTANSDEKITSSYQPGFADPYGANSGKSQSQRAVAGQYQFAFGGAIGTMQNGINYGFVEYNKLIVETSQEITNQVVPELSK